MSGLQAIGMAGSPTNNTELRLGCEGHVAIRGGLFTPAPDHCQTTDHAARANVLTGGPLTVTADRTVQIDRMRPMRNRGGYAIEMTRQAEETGATRNSQWWPMGGLDRRQPGPTTTPAGPKGSSPKLKLKKAEGRRANADPIACLATRDTCAVSRSSPVSMS